MMLAFLAAIGATIVAVSAPPAASAACGTGQKLSAAQLNGVFASPGLGRTGEFEGFGGGDYQHAYTLPDGRVLWLFQDMYFSNDDNLNEPPNDAAHNAGLIQNGSCFSVLGSQGRDFIGDALTVDGGRWFWPLDGEIGFDGNLWIFMVEMSNPNGDGANLGALPVRTWLAKLDPVTLQQLYFQPAPDSSPQLYGWSVTSDDHFSYLFGHCYRQFANPANGSDQFDSRCMPYTYLARVPLGHFDVGPEYWNGTDWSVTLDRAVPVMARGAANPMSVQWFGDVWVSATKIDDWWGSVVYVDKAPTPHGPWTTDRTIPVVADRKYSDGCANYSASLMPWLDTVGNMTIGLSSLTAGLSSARWNRRVMAVDPQRLVDTRGAHPTFGRLAHGSASVLDLRTIGIPAGTTAVALNLTTVNAALDGWVRAYPCSLPEPATSNVNQVAGRTQTNAVIVPIGDGRICFRTLTDVDITVDLNGWLTTESDVGLQPVASRRLVDTRSGLGGSTRLQAGQVIEVPVLTSGSPATAVALNVTAVDPSAAGYVSLWPCGLNRPIVSNLNPEPGITQPNFVNVRVGDGGAVCVYTSQRTDLVIDVLAEYRPGAAARYASLSPQRLLDSRAHDAPRHASNLSYLIAMGSVIAAQVNITATNAHSAGYLTAYPCLTEQWPGTSNLNFTATAASANSALATNSRGYACLFSSVPTEVVVDIFGIWTR